MAVPFDNVGVNQFGGYPPYWSCAKYFPNLDGVLFVKTARS